MSNVYGSATPPNVNGSTTGPRGILTNFAVSADSTLVGVRFYSVASMSTDVITVVVYDAGVANQSELSAFTFTPDASVGWHTYSLPTPVALTASLVYTLVIGLETGTIKYGYAVAALPDSANGITLSNSFVRTGGSLVWRENNATALTDIDAYAIDIEVVTGDLPTSVHYASITTSTSWTPFGGSLPDVLEDSSDSTGATTSGNPSSLPFDGILGGVQAPASGTSVTVTWRGRRNAGTTGTIVAELYDDTTLVSTDTQSPATSYGPVTFTFPWADISAVPSGSWAAGMRLVLTVSAS